ncbi:MAG: AraC family ligand binding domain-containing protein, partial [Pseudomonadota bacterium]
MMKDESSAIRVTPVMQLVAQGRWKTEALHALESHLLIWFSKGQGRLSVAGTRYSYGANTVVFLPAGTPHSFEAKPGTYGVAVDIALHPALEMPATPIIYRPRDLLRHAEFVGFFEALQREVAREVTPANERACRYHCGILGVWLERQENQFRDGRSISASQRLARRYATLLETRFTSGANVQDMASELGVTPTHLTRACRSSSGASAHEL